jgi:hypothetical protein
LHTTGNVEMKVAAATCQVAADCCCSHPCTKHSLRMASAVSLGMLLVSGVVPNDGVLHPIISRGMRHQHSTGLRSAATLEHKNLGCEATPCCVHLPGLTAELAALLSSLCCRLQHPHTCAPTALRCAPPRAVHCHVSTDCCAAGVCGRDETHT